MPVHIQTTAVLPSTLLAFSPACITFLEELSDAADTLANATTHSLVIMDELGR